MAASNKVRAVVIAIATLTAGAEGLRQRVYKDAVGVPTVCYGTTGKAVIEGKFYTEPECKALLIDGLMEKAQKVDKCAPDAPNSVLAAFTDAAYNVGEKIACDTKHSTAARLLAAKEWRRACMELPKWDKAQVAGMTVSLPGLTKRRAEDLKWCLKDLPA